MQNTDHKTLSAGGGGGLPKCSCGFTLAETLITLGIIGIIAAITLPSIIGRYQEKVTISQLKQTYSLLSQAFAMAIEEHGTVDSWCDMNSIDTNTCSKIIKSRIEPYIKRLHTQKDHLNHSFAKSYKNRFNTNTWTRIDPNFVMANGTAVMFNAYNGDGYTSAWCKEKIRYSYDSSKGYQRSCGTIYVDINSHKKPNVDGLDLFAFKIYQNGITPKGRKADTIWVESFKNQCLGQQYYAPGSCTAWVLINENMDYLRCNDLSWDGKTKCK